MHRIELEITVGSHRILHRLAVVAICAWGISVGAADAAIRDDLPPSNGSELIEFGLAMRDIGSPPRRQWMKIQWAGLSPEQREELRNQVREHRQRTRDDYRRDERHDMYRAPPPPDPRGGRQQRLSPEERQELRQWMRDRRGDDRGRGR